MWACERGQRRTVLPSASKFALTVSTAAAGSDWMASSASNEVMPLVALPLIDSTCARPVLGGCQLGQLLQPAARGRGYHRGGQCALGLVLRRLGGRGRQSHLIPIGDTSPFCRRAVVRHGAHEHLACTRPKVLREGRARARSVTAAGVLAAKGPLPCALPRAHVLTRVRDDQVQADTSHVVLSQLVRLLRRQHARVPVAKPAHERRRLVERSLVGQGSEGFEAQTLGLEIDPIEGAVEEILVQQSPYLAGDRRTRQRGPHSLNPGTRTRLHPDNPLSIRVWQNWADGQRGGEEAYGRTVAGLLDNSRPMSRCPSLSRDADA